MQFTNTLDLSLVYLTENGCDATGTATWRDLKSGVLNQATHS